MTISGWRFTSNSSMIATLPFSMLVIDTLNMEFAHQLLFIPKIEAFLKNPPSPLPKLVHVSVEGVSKGSKIPSLQRLLPAEDLLLL